MKLSKIISRTAVLLTLALVLGCAEAPQQDIQTAQAALDAATKAEAERYAATEYTAAQDSLRAALSAIDEQKSKFALFRDYTGATELLVAATTTANRAAETAKVQKEKAQQEAQDLIAQAQTAIAAGKELLQKAPKGKEGRAALEAMQTDLAALETALAEAGDLINKGDFLSARDKAKACLDKATAIGEELQAAIAKAAPHARRH